MWLVALGVLALTAGVFAPAVGAEFLNWDDNVMVLQNKLLQSGDISALGAFWRSGYQGLYTPLAYSLWWVWQCLGGLKPGWFHLLNLLLHLGGVLGLFCLLRQVFFLAKGDKPGLGGIAVGTLFFALHPLQVEAVAWVAGMNNLLAGALGLWGMYCYFRYVQREKWLWLGLALLLYTLALLSKPTAVVMPLLLLALDVGVVGKSWRKGIWTAGVGLLLAVPIMVVTRVIQPAESIHYALWARPLVAMQSLGFYVVKMVAPLNLTADYGQTPNWQMAHLLQAPYWLAGVGLLGLAGVALYRRRFALGAMLLVIPLAVSPVLGLTPFEYQRYSSTSDRYAYLTLMALALALVMVVKTPGRTWGALVVAVVLGVASFLYCQCWHDNFSWCQNVLQQQPRSLAGHQVLSYTLAGQDRVQEALVVYQEGVMYHPEDWRLRYNLGNLLLRQNHPGEAWEMYAAGLKISASQGDMLNNGYIAAGRAGRMQEYAVLLEELLQKKPDSAVLHTYYGWVCLAGGRPDLARVHFERALEINPAQGKAKAGLAELQRTTTGN